MDREFRRSRGRGVGLVVALALLSLLIAACGGGSATPTPAALTDPNAILARATSAPMDQVEVKIGIKTSGSTSGSDISIDPDSIVITIDSQAGKGSFHLSLPSSALGSDASMLGALGASGDTIDLDVLFDGQAVYAKSPLAASLLPLLMAQSGQTISGDLTGWLRLGTADDFAALGETFGALPGASPGASAAPEVLPSFDPKQLQADLEASGVTLTYAGTESHNGVDADHLTMTIDGQKLATGPLASDMPSIGGSQLQDLANAGTLTADAWFDHSTGRVMELDLQGTDSSGCDVQPHDPREHPVVDVVRRADGLHRSAARAAPPDADAVVRRIAPQPVARPNPGSDAHKWRRASAATVVSRAVGPAIAPSAGARSPVVARSPAGAGPSARGWAVSSPQVPPVPRRRSSPGDEGCAARRPGPGRGRDSWSGPAGRTPRA